MGEVVVCGGSMVGLVSATLLAREGHHVTVIEGDDAPLPDAPARAWELWDRKGVAQFRQPHGGLARSRQILDDELPGANDALLEAGCVVMNPIETLPPFIADTSPRAGDARFRAITGRRPVVEAAIARFVGDQPGLDIRRGVAVADLREGAAVAPEVPHVNGVHLADGEDLPADLIVDAMGRRSKLAQWLGVIGAKPPTVDSENAGFVYYSRYFRGSRPAAISPPLTPLGSMSLLTLWGDNQTWSVTVFASADDPELRGLRDPARFARVVAACPLHAHWLEGDPITDVIPAAGILDRRHRYVVDDRPVVTGVVAVGDAWACTNPSAGRGLSVGLLHAQRLRDVVRGGLHDPEILVRRFDTITDAEVAPFFNNQLAADRLRVAEMNALRRGTELSAPDPFMAATAAAMAQDPEVYRAVIETITCLALPQDVFSRPDFLERVKPFAGHSPIVFPGPDRSQLVDLASRS
jgi:2-polyprenyl-6-methoxyphenol hydroxylase-like FAD-dependent oxidoreductase